jgi:peptidoglycan glycosyltransferase
MPTEYKYMDRDDSSRRTYWGRRIFLAFLFLLIISVLTYALFFFQTRKIEEWIITGQYSKAQEKLLRWKWLPMVSGRVYEALGTAELLSKNANAANPTFKIASEKIFFRPMGIWQDVLKILWSNGRYEDGLAYSDHIEPKLSGQAVIHFYRAGYLTGQNQLQEASKELATAGNPAEFRNEISKLKTEIDHRSATGQYAFLIDREELPIVNISLKGDAVVLAESLKPVLKNSVFDLISSLKSDPQNPAILSIDYRMQNAAMKALGKYAGAIVLINVKNGDILAAASNPKGVNSEHSPDTSLALTEFYEPGSIIKMITLAGSLENGIDFGKILPFDCKGSLELPDSKVLYDWKVHGLVKDIDTATAVSCNVAFAKIGLAMKPAELISNLKRFGFNSRLQNKFLPLELGKIIEGDPGDSYLSNLSIGLDYLRMTPLHAALLASAIANGGTAMMPRLYVSRRNIVGIPFSEQPVSEYGKFMNEKTAQTLTHAMVEVVKNFDGTGRRAAMEGFPIALKTGTAGEGAKGYNAILIGFGPVPNPKIAFSIFLEHAGKAELEGARVAKLFLESIQAYIK